VRVFDLLQAPDQRQAGVFEFFKPGFLSLNLRLLPSQNAVLRVQAFY